MGNLLFGINIVLPIFLVGALGFFLRKIGLIQEAFLTGISKLLFSVSIPCMLFNSLSGSAV
jgi:predicted permease